MPDPLSPQVHPAVLQFASALAALPGTGAADLEGSLLTIDEAKLILRVSRATVVRAIRAGDLPTVQLRRTYRIPAAFLRHVIETAAQGASVVVEEAARRWIAEHPECGQALELVS